jgi:hypothetical protein
MSLRRQVIDTVFGGNRDPLARIITQVGDATSPDGVVSAPIGTFLCIDYNGDASDDDIYINTNGHATPASATWSLIYDASTLGHLYA